MDTFDLIASERRRLADALEELGPDDWSKPSLCAGWTNHDVVAHLNVPFLVPLPRFAIGMLKALGNFDVANDRFARDTARRLTPADLIEGLRVNAEARFTPPGFGPEAPLVDVVSHGADILQPLGRSVEAAPEVFTIGLPFLVEGKGRRFTPKGALEDLRVEATDVGLVAGTGSTVVRGPAHALMGALLGRAAYLPQLTGDEQALRRLAKT